MMETCRIRRSVLFSLALLLLSACVQPLEAPEDAGPHTARLVLDGSLLPFEDGADTKAAAALTWKTGDIIYVRTETTAGVNTSHAVRNADGSWTFNYTGSLRSGNTVRCCYFQSPRSADAYSVTLSYNSIIYEDASAMLKVDGGDVILTTHLKPMTGRITFTGATGSVGIHGLSWYNSFDLASFEFTETVNASVSSFSVGSGKYFYGFFGEDNPDRELFITNEGLVFKRACGENVLRSGASGFMTVPNHSAYDGWTLTNAEDLVRYQPIQIEDAYFKDWLLAQGYDKDGDGEISYAEGEKITSIINENNESVSSLKGIEHFPNLRTLRWTGSEYWDNGRVVTGKLTAVDVSHNVKLTELDLSNNHLTSIDISNNPQMQHLTLRCNDLTIVNLSGASKLDYLDVPNNKLSSIDLSSCPNLESLYIYDNQFTSFDFSICPKLRVLGVGENQFTSLDVSSLADLDDLSCYTNRLSSLDISANTKLRRLDIGSNADLASIDLSHCPDLESLSIGSTGIKSIDLSVCPNIYYLWCSYIDLETLDVTALSNLQYFYCYGCGLTSLDLSGNPRLRDFGCGNNNLGSLDLSACPQLQSLYCYSCGLTELMLDSSFTKLIYLSCAGNDFSASGLNLSGCPNLTELDCNSCHLSVLDLSSNLKLSWVNCCWNDLTTLDVYANSNLDYLNVEYNTDLERVVVKNGHVFSNGIYYNGITEILYED